MKPSKCTFLFSIVKLEAFNLEIDCYSPVSVLGVALFFALLAYMAWSASLYPASRDPP